MKVAFITVSLDLCKGGNHLPLLSAMPNVTFTIIANRVRLGCTTLPKNIQVVTLNCRTGPYYYGCSDWLFARSLLKKYPPDHTFWKQFDIIHLNQTLGPQLIKLKKAGHPVAYLIHHPVTADRRVATEETSGFTQLQWRLRYVLLCHWQRRLCRSFDHIITVSDTVKERLQKDYDCAPRKIVVIHNGVDTDRFCPANNSQKKIDVIALGSFTHPRKGFPYLRSTYEQLAARGYTIADVGRRTEEQIACLRSIPNVTVHGTVEADELLRLLRTSRTLLSTALYEGFGLSIIEALSCGLPAFAFGAGAVPEVLKPIDDRLICRPRDTDALVTKISDFLSQPDDEQCRQGQEYRRRVAALYPLQASARQLESFYTSIILNRLSCPAPPLTLA